MNSSIQDILQNRWGILYLLQALAKDPKSKDQVCYSPIVTSFVLLSCEK